MIRYCIWDIGQVTYQYSLTPLQQWCLKHGKQTKDINEQFSFADYMCGKYNFSTMCQKLCTFYNIDYKAEYEQQINQALHDGVGPLIAETTEMRKNLWNCGIINGILSNALPCLADTIKGLNVNHYCCFASYDLGFLKPDAQIFKSMLKKLNCPASEVIFVDDKQQNVLAAQCLGINGVLFRPGHLQKDIQTLLIPTL